MSAPCQQSSCILAHQYMKITLQARNVFMYWVASFFATLENCVSFPQPPNIHPRPLYAGDVIFGVLVILTTLGFNNNNNNNNNINLYMYNLEAVYYKVVTLELSFTK